MLNDLLTGLFLDLSTVDEIPDDEYSDPENDDPFRSAARSLSRGNSSAFTGHHSDTVILELDRGSMIDALPELLQSSETLLSLIEKDGKAEVQLIYEDLQLPASTFARRLRHRLFVLDELRQHYGDNDINSFISVRIAVRKMANAGHWSEVGDGQWRPDSILHMANVAKFVASMFFGPTADESIRILTELQFVHPAPFQSQFLWPASSILGPSSTRLMDATVSLGLDIRTQCLISLFSQRKGMTDFDPDDILGQAFYIDETKLRGFDPDEEHAQLPVQYEQVFTRRIESIRRHFGTEEPANFVDLDGLTAAFPWTDFLVELAGWAKLRTAELCEQISRQGGAQQIKAMLQKLTVEEQVFESEQLPGPRGLVTEQVLASTSEMVVRAKANNHDHSSKHIQSTEARAKRLKERGAALRARRAQKVLSNAAIDGSKRADHNAGRLEVDATPRVDDEHIATSAEQPEGEEAQIRQQSLITAQFKEPGTPNIDEKPVANSLERGMNRQALSQSSQQVLATLARHKAQSNKENTYTSQLQRRAFVDRQRNAQKITWEDSQEAEAEPREPRTSHLNPCKRHHDEDEDDDEGEDEFESDSRSPNDARRREAHSDGANKRARLQSLPDVTDGLPGDGSEEDSQQSAVDRQLHDVARLANERQRGSISNAPEKIRAPFRQSNSTRLPSSSAPLRVESSTPFDSQNVYESSQAVNRRAKFEVARRKPRMAQQRTPYSEEETARLIELVETYGTSYAYIKQMDEKHPGDPSLQNRTQLQLKDKARNLKMDYLKYGLPIPRSYGD